MTAIGFVKEGKYVGVRELRENLAKMIKSRRAYFVTDHGKPVKAMIPYEVLLELLETLEEFKDKALIQEAPQGRKEPRQTFAVHKKISLKDSARFKVADLGQIKDIRRKDIYDDVV